MCAPSPSTPEHWAREALETQVSPSPRSMANSRRRNQCVVRLPKWAPNGLRLGVAAAALHIQVLRMLHQGLAAVASRDAIAVIVRKRRSPRAAPLGAVPAGLDLAVGAARAGVLDQARVLARTARVGRLQHRAV
eukprot:CAMPEP_0174374764 /NCGR_PEP_ID=MMETSP0811_2-20130205/112141_1 /TAXON_ID=73025 ORGANISM="Eutreptiella gymnastica-like, Strain CCMP1594" /NCGR_SAMPLE_ID=MMETSP0811_2 /ASSEMBLY_ACC=CAM_ASM_000667 /LENGTH=133 /DNA_ID=CAMNT_0015524379 /DNA_START=83 /DNA_END=484 /DNA_ORIENTATION=-